VVEAALNTLTGRVANDAWNRLTAAYADDSGEEGDLIALYAYDGRGYRVSKAAAVYDEGDLTGYDRTDYYYNDVAQPPSAVGWQCLEERFIGNAPSPLMGEGWGEGDMTPHVQYLWSVVYIDTPVLRWRDADGDPQTGAGGLEETLYYAIDANMNVTEFRGHNTEFGGWLQFDEAGIRGVQFVDRIVAASRLSRWFGWSWTGSCSGPRGRVVGSQTRRAPRSRPSPCHEAYQRANDLAAWQPRTGLQSSAS
jgi:hypothetical protein